MFMKHQSMQILYSQSCSSFHAYTTTLDKRTTKLQKKLSSKWFDYDKQRHLTIQHGANEHQGTH